MEEQSAQALTPASSLPPTPRDVITITEERPTQTFPRLSGRSASLRDFMAVIFRYRGLVLSSFLSVFLGILLLTLILPEKYETSMKILVKRERADPLVTPQPNASSYLASSDSQEDLNSEAELIKSRDLLEKVVVSCGLHTFRNNSWLARLRGSPDPIDQELPSEDTRIPGAVRALQQSLTVEPIAKSKLIEVTYEAQDPKLAANVLQTLASLYLEKHLAVHRPPGVLDFFQKQTEQYRLELAAAEQQLASFGQDKGVVSVEIEKDITLRKLNDFESQLRETQVSEEAATRRIRSLEGSLAKKPARITTQVRTFDNPYLLEKLKSTLLGLELKRTELLTKYEPGYRAVQEVDAQIAQAAEALEKAEKNTLRDEVTDLDRTSAWMDEELARARAELDTVRGRSAVFVQCVEDYREKARQIGRREIEHAELVRSVKTAEENYLLYLRKQEEARISDALDRNRIVNVAVAEAATVPAEPSSPNWIRNSLLALFLATFVSLGLVFVANYLNHSFRTPDEVEDYLGLPVLASLPRMQLRRGSGSSRSQFRESMIESY
jgi:uncharacterized protein involved in exopolysaccharide biosynthesis